MSKTIFCFDKIQSSRRFSDSVFLHHLRTARHRIVVIVFSFIFFLLQFVFRDQIMNSAAKVINKFDSTKFLIHFPIKSLEKNKKSSYICTQNQALIEYVRNRNTPQAPYRSFRERTSRSLDAYPFRELESVRNRRCPSFGKSIKKVPCNLEITKQHS